MAEINWGLLQTPDFFTDAMKYQHAGQERAQTDAKRAAYQQYATDPQGAINALMYLDPASAMDLRKARREDAKDATRTKATGLYASGKTAEARQAALGSGDFDLATAIGKMDADQHAEAKAKADQLAALGEGLSGKSYEERKAIIQQIKPELVSRGIFDAATIDGFDPTDTNITAFRSQALGLKGILEQADKNRNFGLKQDQFTETKRANHANEGLRAQSNATASFGAQTGRLSYEARKAAGGFGTPGVNGGGPIPDHDVEVDQ